MSAPAYLPLFGSDYLADTSHLSTEEHGAYLLLMMAAWRQDDCGLPVDDKKLARITGLSVRKWTAIKETILEFWTVENGRIYQPRLLKEWVYACKKSEGNRENARKRWNSQTTENKQNGSCDRISDGNAPQPQPHIEEPNGSSPPVSPEPKSKRSKKILTIEIPDWVPLMQWDAFIEMRRRKGAFPTDYAAERLIAKLDEFRAQGHDPRRVLDQSTVKNWTDIFPIKDQNHGNRSFSDQPRDTRDGFQRHLDGKLELIAAERAAREAGRQDDQSTDGFFQLPMPKA